MNSSRELLIYQATAATGLPEAFAALVVRNAPWLDGTEEVNQNLGPELLAELCREVGIDTAAMAAFFDNYNIIVQLAMNPYQDEQQKAYEHFSRTLEPYGHEDACGGGDYWIVEDSFTTKYPVVILFKDFRLQSAALEELQLILNQYSFVFSELRLNTEDGDNILTLCAA